jgi:predicted amidophosphoribosyltransferase
MRGLSWPFAQCLAQVILADPSIIGVPIVPVPPRSGKMREKGWDQIEDLVKILSRIYNIPVIRCLTRTGGLQQKKLGRVERLRNIRGNISVIPGITIPERAIILDDLVTTGSTLDSCAEALKNAGCGKVYGLALFFD